MPFPTFRCQAESLRNLLQREDARDALIDACELLQQAGLWGAGVARLRPRPRWLARAGDVEAGKATEVEAPRHVAAVEPLADEACSRVRCYLLDEPTTTYLILNGPELPHELLEEALTVTAVLLGRVRPERRQRALQRILERQQNRRNERDLGLEATRSRARHDLRAPLTAFKGYVEMISKGMAGPVSPTLERYLNRMRAAADHEHELIEAHLGRRTA